MAVSPKADPTPRPTTPTPIAPRPIQRVVAPGSDAAGSEVHGVGVAVAVGVEVAVGVGVEVAVVLSSRLSIRMVAVRLSGPTRAVRVRGGRPGDVTTTAWSPGSTGTATPHCS